MHDRDDLLLHWAMAVVHGGCQQDSCLLRFFGIPHSQGVYFKVFLEYFEFMVGCWLFTWQSLMSCLCIALNFEHGPTQHIPLAFALHLTFLCLYMDLRRQEREGSLGSVASSAEKAFLNK